MGWLCGSPYDFHPNCTYNAIELARRPSDQHLLPCDQLMVGVTPGHDLWTTLCKLWVRPCPNGGQAGGVTGMSDREQSERATISNHRPVWCWCESSFFNPLDSNYRLPIWPPVAMWLWLPLVSPAVAWYYTKTVQPPYSIDLLLWSLPSTISICSTTSICWGRMLLFIDTGGGGG